MDPAAHLAVVQEEVVSQHRERARRVVVFQGRFVIVLHGPGVVGLHQIVVRQAGVLKVVAGGRKVERQLQYVLADAGVLQATRDAKEEEGEVHHRRHMHPGQGGQQVCS